MAEWCNAYLMVVGTTRDVRDFARRARDKPRNLGWVPDIIVDDGEVTLVPRPQGKPDAIFIPDMWSGEGGDLWSERIRGAGKGLSQKRYHFQIRNDDGRRHFRKVSTRHPKLHFVLTNHWGPPDECDSFLIHAGRTKAYRMPEAVISSVHVKYGYDPDLESDNEEDYEDMYWIGWEASWEMMNIAESHWLTGLLAKLRDAAPRTRAREESGSRGASTKR